MMNQLYRVRHGDTPTTIARHSGVIKPTAELVYYLLQVNPHKQVPYPDEVPDYPWGPDGAEFIYEYEPVIILRDGEYLTLPDGWDCPPHRSTW